MDSNDPFDPNPFSSPEGGGESPFPRASHLPAQGSSPMAIAALVLAIIGVLTSIWGGVLLELPALIFAIISLRQVRADPSLGGRGMALAALIISSVSLVLLAVALIALVVFCGGMGF